MLSFYEHRNDGTTISASSLGDDEYQVKKKSGLSEFRWTEIECNNPLHIFLELQQEYLRQKLKK